MNALPNIYAEGDPDYEDQHLQPLDPIIVEGEGYLYGIRSVQIVALKESVRGNDFIATYSGPNHSAGITAAGQVFTWGANDMRQLGYPGAEEGILGIDMDPRPVSEMQGSVVVAASCGKHHTVVITEDGQVFAWGAFGNGQLGIGEVSRDKFPFGYVDGPTKVHALDTAAPRSVACGFFHTVIVDGLGDIWTCGTGDHGVHGHEHHFDQPVPLILQSIHGHDFRQVSCGSSHTIALTAQGHIYVWGMNEQGQLGLGDNINRRVPVLNGQCNGKNIRKIACGEAHTAFLSDRDVFTFGDGSHGALGHGNSKSQLTPKPVIKLNDECRLRDLECGPQFTVALSDLGQMYFWGNMRSTSGRGTKNVFNMPRRFKGLEAIYGVSCGEHEVTALVRIPIAPPLEHKFKAGIFLEEAGSGLIEGYIGRVCTWGKASDGKLGHGVGSSTQADLKTPFAIYGPLYHYSITVVGCGDDHSVCITDDGRLFTWGSNKEGQLGLRDFKTRLQPTMIECCHDPDVPRLKNTKNKIFTDVIVGNWHCLAITSKKKVYAWGKNKYGQLGLGHTNNLPLPTSILPLSDPLNPKNVRCMAAGKGHSAVIAEDGDVYTWGRGWDGQLGHDVVTEIELEPRIVPHMENRASAAVSCGSAHTVVVTDNGNVWAWGDNKSGQLGTGTLISTSTPAFLSTMEEQEVTHVACGMEHTIVVTIANEVYGFGNGVYDQLGLGTLGIFPKPQRIPGLTAVPRIQSVACGRNSTAVIGGDDTAYMLGTWDGLTLHVQSKLSKYATVRRSTKGTMPDLLEPPLGIDEVKAICMSGHHGMIIGLEEDRQRLIQRRLDHERQELVKAIQLDTDDQMTFTLHRDEGQRRLVQPYVTYGHGGDPFPDELDNPDLVSKVVAASNNIDIHSEFDDDEGTENGDAYSESGVSKKSGRSAWTAMTGTSMGSTAGEARAADAIESREMSVGARGVVIGWGSNTHGQLGLAQYKTDAHGNAGSIAFAMKKWVKDKIQSSASRTPMAPPKDKIAISPTPLYQAATAINVPSVLSVACGEFHTIVICTEGTLYSWGKNDMGQLGHGDKKSRHFPAQVMALAKKICIKAACGGQHSLVLTDANKLYGWGSNVYGQLGMNVADKLMLTPDIVPSLRRSGSCHVVCGYSHTVALLKNEQLYVWGRNDCGQLGLGHYTHSPIPEHVTALKRYQVQQVDCGYDHCIAFVAEDKGADTPPIERVYSWGRGEEGQLGHSDVFSRCVPRSVRTLEARGIRAVHAGGFSSAAIDEAKQVYTWGDSREGQLGHADETALNCPAIVKEPFNEDKPKGDFQGTFRARTLFVGPHYMVAMGLDAEKEKKQDPLNDKIDLDKFSWGCNSHGQLGMPFLNLKGRKTGHTKSAPERIPFMKKWNFKEMACGLHHVIALVDVSESSNQNVQRDDDVEKLIKDLTYLASGDLEEDVNQHSDDEMQFADNLSDEEDDLGYAVPKGGMGADDDDDDFDEEDELEKLHYPKQIFTRDHSVSPLIRRIGLSKYAGYFDDQNITFEAFLDLNEDHLMDMGITTFGAKRRILRAVFELQHALRADDDEDFVPPEYEGPNLELERGFHKHEADYLNVMNGIAVCVTIYVYIYV